MSFNDGIIHEIPGELLVKILIQKPGEQAQGIGENHNHRWTQEKNNVPDSGRLAAMIEDQQKRGLLDTVSTTLSDKPASKMPRHKDIPNPVPE